MKAENSTTIKELLENFELQDQFEPELCIKVETILPNKKLHVYTRYIPTGEIIAERILDRHFKYLERYKNFKGDTTFHTVRELLDINLDTKTIIHKPWMGRVFIDQYSHDWKTVIRTYFVPRDSFDDSFWINSYTYSLGKQNRFCRRTDEKSYDEVMEIYRNALSKDTDYRIRNEYWELSEYVINMG